MDLDRFYEITKNLFQLAPWDYLGNEDYCQMFMENESQLVCVTGSLVTQNFGFIICRDALQADYFLSLKDKIEESEISAYRRYQHYTLFYKRYNEMNAEERSFFRENEFYSGDDPFPVLKHVRWDRPETNLTAEEEEALCNILENLYLLINSVAFGKIRKTSIEFNEVPTRIYNPKTKECDNLYFPFMEEMFRISPYSVIDQEKIETNYKNLEFNDLVVEYDLLYLPLKKDDGTLLALGVLWDVIGRRSLDVKLMEIKEAREATFMNLYLEYLLKYGCFLEVRCRDNIDKKLLASLDIPNKPKYAVEKLENVDTVVSEVMAKYY